MNKVENLARGRTMDDLGFEDYRYYNLKEPKHPNNHSYMMGWSEAARYGRAEPNIQSAWEERGNR